MISRKLAEFVNELELSKVPNDAVEAAKNCLLDYCGASLGGHQLRSSQITIEYANELGGREESTILGTDIKVPAPQAAMVNGTLGSCLDVDDGHILALGHPGAVVIPAALAAAEEQKSTGKELLEAIIAGYEIAINCGRVLNSSYSELFNGSGSFSVYGAAAAVGKILKLNIEQMCNAFGICEANRPWAQCLDSIDNGSMTKESMGWGSMTGLTSSYLAAKGFTGPADMLIDKGIFDTKSYKVFETIGKKYEISNVYFKRYTACRWGHSSIEAALQIREEQNLKPEDIKSIKIKTFKLATTLCHKRPKSSEAAQYSIPFPVACAFVDGEVGPEQVNESRINDNNILKVADLVELIADEQLEKEFPATRPAIIRVETIDGRIFEKKVAVLKGDSALPLTKEDLENKFIWLSKKILGIEEAKKATEFINIIENKSDISILLKSLFKSE